MRVREKRKQQKEQKPQKQATPTTAAEQAKLRETNLTPPPAPPSTPTLPATEKVAFDNRIKRKNVLALNEKVAALREYDRQPVYKHVGRMFNCSPDQIKRIVQQREPILRAWEQRTRRCQDARTLEMKVVRVSMLGRAVYDWIRRMMYYKDFSISDGLIQKMALQFKSSMGLNHFFPHQEWCDKFRQTYNIQNNDTKLLNIGYTQSFSVQIKDIVKDVMSECTPEATAAIAADGEDDGEEGISLGGGTNTTGSSHGGDDDDDADVDVDGGDLSQPEDDEDEDVKPTLSELNLTRVLPQLMQLPIQTNSLPGTSQKVLLATPIVPPGTAPATTAAQAVTMTIIPLATLKQSITKRSSPQSQELGTATTTQAQAKTLNMPPPMLEVKQEIKTEPNSVDEQQPEQPASPVVRIKQELESDTEQDELDDEDDANGGRSSVTSLAEVLAANVEDEKEYIEQTRALRGRKRSHTPDVEWQAKLASMPPLSVLPPLPVLTKAPTTKRTSKRRHDDNNNAGSDGDATNTQSQSIITCAEARKYLKLLEDFALCRENYRLIELITRADEVMREMGDE